MTLELVREEGLPDESHDETYFRLEVRKWLEGAGFAPAADRRSRLAVGRSCRGGGRRRPGVPACAVRRRLRRAELAGAVRRPGAHAPPRVHLRPGGRPLRAAQRRVLDRARDVRADAAGPWHRGAEGPLHPAHAPGRGDLVAGLLRTRGRLRSRRPANQSGARRRRVDPHRAEGLDLGRPDLAVRPGLGPQRRQAAPPRRAHHVHRRSRRPRRVAAAAQADDGSRQVRRGLPRRRAGGRRPPRRRRERRLALRHHHAHERAVFRRRAQVRPAGRLGPAHHRQGPVAGPGRRSGRPPATGQPLGQGDDLRLPPPPGGRRR